MEKDPAASHLERPMSMDSELEKQISPRIAYADLDDHPGRVQNQGRRSSLGLRRRGSRDSISVRSMRRASVDPALVLPPQYRTISFNIEEGKRMQANADAATESKKSKKHSAEIHFGDIDHHTADVDTLFSRYESSRTTGLTSAQAAKQLSIVGPNKPTPPPSRWMQKTFTYLYGGFGAVLFIAAILVFIAWRPLGQPPAPANLALAIVLVVVWLVQAFFSFWQDFSSSRVMSSISTMLPEQCIVLRDGTQQRIEGKDVVPGDVLRITMGNKLPADVRFVEASSDARFDRSVLTGETVPMLATVDSSDKNYLETACIGMAGTHCVSGSAWGLVLETGDRTVFGRIAKLTSAPKSGLTPLQREIYYFIAIIVSLMLLSIVIVLIVWGAYTHKAYPEWITVPTLIVDCVSIAVAFVPEGLPIAVTASLTITANAMRRNKVLCKSLKTVETLGAVNVICSDKTGTLTRNLMAVTEYLSGSRSGTAAEAKERHASDKSLQKLATLGAVCNDAEFDASTLDKPLLDRKINGDATDSAILRFAEGIQSVSQLRNSSRSLFKVAFNSKNKYAINVTEAQSTNIPLLMIKGAPDILLPRCASYIDGQGELKTMSEQERRSMEVQKDEWSSQGRRVILLAEKRLEKLRFDPITQPREYELDIMGRATTDLCLVGLIAIVDPPRQEIPEVVRTLRGAGIRLFMVTGDFQLTAAAIAAECGIITQRPEQVENVSHLHAASKDSTSAHSSEKEIDISLGPVKSIVLSGADLETLEDSHWDKVSKYDEVVFARTTPDHKLRIVKELQKRNLTVGMTGDGVNDAPSLKAADVGIAMGSGSDVAIEAADMVLLDSFAAIVEAVRYGRVVYDNLKKTICYLLPAGSFSEFWPVMTNCLFGAPQILSSFLMIIICCFTDCAAATAIAYEKPEADVLTRPPRNAKKDRLVDWKLIVHAYGIIGVLETITSFAMSYWYCQRQGLTFSTLWFGYGNVPNTMTADTYADILNTASSIYFVNLVVMQWFNLFAVRTRRLSVLSHSINWYLFPAIVFALVMAIFFLYVPAFHNVLGTTAVPVEHWFLPMAFGMGILLLDESRKWFNRKHPKSFLARMAW